MPLFARDLIAVQQLLGYAQPETTAVYARVPDGALLTAVGAPSGRP
jgi:site-specific recombinase XerD